jgi:uncharacterized membrane protein
MVDHRKIRPLLTLPSNVFNKVGSTDGMEFSTDTALIALSIYQRAARIYVKNDSRHRPVYEDLYITG